MADNIEQISLNFMLPPSSGSGGSASVGGTIQVDYTTNTVSKQIAASDSMGTTNDTFSTFTLSYDQTKNTYTVTGTGSNSAQDTLSFSYVSMMPSQINNVALALGSTQYAAQSEPVAAAAVCYAAGTRIRVWRDGGEQDVAVEHLVIGDLAVTASSAHRPIRWIGRRSYSGVFTRRNPDFLPVRFAAGSIADNTPVRDLCVSPRHAMLLDGLLVPAEALVNGMSITKAGIPDRIDYFHVELDSHDILIAESALSESYVEDDNRGFFHNAADHVDAGMLSPPAVYCLPRVEEGHALEAIRQRLTARALAISRSAHGGERAA